MRRCAGCCVCANLLDAAQVRMASERDRRLLEEDLGSMIAAERKRKQSKSIKQAFQAKVRVHGSHAAPARRFSPRPLSLAAAIKTDPNPALMGML